MRAIYAGVQFLADQPLAFALLPMVAPFLVMSHVRLAPGDSDPVLRKEALPPCAICG